MKLQVTKVFFLLIVSSLLYPFISHSQDLSGIWKGEFFTDEGMSYKLEFQIIQNKKKTVTGVSYSWGRNIKFYGKATMTGFYALDQKSFSIQEIKTVEVKSSGGGTCIMNYKFTYTRSGKEEFLEGTYVGKSEDRLNPKNNGTWGDCGGGKVFLRRVAKSEFYVEPFLRNKTVAKSPPIGTKPAPKVTTTKPPAKTIAKTPVKTPAKTTTRVPVTTTQTKPKVLQNKVQDTVRKNTSIVNNRTIEIPKIEIPPTTRSRKNELVQTITVSSREINVRLYDNGEVDNDTISVYMDGVPLATNKRLSTVPISLTVNVDENNPEHILVMVAENLGKIPPNTSLMIVQDGDKRYQVSITSTEQKNAMVRFRYKPKD